MIEFISLLEQVPCTAYLCVCGSEYECECGLRREEGDGEEVYG